jgi:hypothetical protein
MSFICKSFPDRLCRVYKGELLGSFPHHVLWILEIKTSWPSSTLTHFLILQTYFSHPRLFPKPQWEYKRSKITNNKPPGPISMSTQWRVGVRLCSGFCQLQHPGQKCWPKLNLQFTESKWQSFFHCSSSKTCCVVHWWRCC